MLIPYTDFANGNLPASKKMVSELRIIQTKDGKTFSEMDQTVNILGFAGHMVSITTTYLCNYSAKAAIDNM